MIKPVEPKKILCIHDLSGMGRCSLAVILPVLSVMGVQPVALPTVVLSTHTGGLGTPARLDGCAYGMAALEHYRELGVEFDCIYTGYLGGEEQVALAEKAFDLWPAAKKVVDPVMGDNGKAYSTVTPEFIDRMRTLCQRADLILPNVTEAGLLLRNETFPENFDEAGAQALADELTTLAPDAIVTGLAMGKYIGCAGSGPGPLCHQKAAHQPQLSRHGRSVRCRAHRLADPGQRPERRRRQRRRVRLAGHPEDARRAGYPLRCLVRAASAPPVPGRLGRIRGGTPMNEKPT